ncbi:hypothetical protein BGS_0818 [Beggiatoa sp. SS]|nr:hypothetical protein BGS_0818 [Beggiatoa sp. SS]
MSFGSEFLLCNRILGHLLIDDNPVKWPPSKISPLKPHFAGFTTPITRMGIKWVGGIPGVDFAPKFF